MATGDREQKQQGNFSRTVKGKHQKTKLIETELWELNKTELIKHKEKINKTSYIQLSKYIYNKFTSLYCHKFMTHINVRYIRCHVPTVQSKI